MDGSEVVMYSLACGSAGYLAYAVYPGFSAVSQRLLGQLERHQVEKAGKAAKVMDDMFMDVKPAWLTLSYRLAPFIGVAVVYLIWNNIFVALLGAVVAMILPDFMVKHAAIQRRKAFAAQLVDVLFMLSSSLRAGLSLTQAFEILESEMSPPSSQEFGLMIKAHRVGVPLEDALQGLNQRMVCEEMNLITTAVLMARATGGDVTKVINQLITTIREKRKLDDKVKTLTLQGKLQAVIMSGLPIIFAVFVRSSNPGYFDLLLHDKLGNTLLFVAIGLWIVGVIILVKVSKVDF